MKNWMNQKPMLLTITFMAGLLIFISACGKNDTTCKITATVGGVDKKIEGKAKTIQKCYEKAYENAMKEKGVVEVKSAVAGCITYKGKKRCAKEFKKLHVCLTKNAKGEITIDGCNPVVSAGAKGANPVSAASLKSLLGGVIPKGP